MLWQLCDDASNPVLIENNRVIPDWGCMCEWTLRASLQQASVSTLCQLCDNASDSVLIEISGIAWKWVATPILEHHHRVVTGPVYIKHQHQHCDHSTMMLVILFSLKLMEMLENGLQPQSGATPLFSMRTGLLASSQRCQSVDADAWCKRTLRYISVEDGLN